MKLLLKSGNRVRALVRTAECAALLPDGAEAAIGDFAQPESLLNALKGVEKALLVLPPEERQPEYCRNVIAAIKRNKVRHAVRISLIGAGSAAYFTLGRLYGETDRILWESGIPTTFLRSHYLMQNLLTNAETTGRNGTLRARMKSGRISLVDAGDVAAVAAAVLTKPGHENRSYDVTGPEALSFHEIAERLSAAAGFEIRYIDIPPEEARKEMKERGMADWLTDAMLGLFGVFSAGYASMTTKIVEQIGRREPVSFTRFAHLHAHRFNPK